jgi:septal ring factor EnvC (AmiA/AmiB activator)
MAAGAEDVVEAIVQNKPALRKLALAIVNDSDLRLAVINSIIRDVATKSDLDSLRKEIDQKMDSLRKEIDQKMDSLRKDANSMESRIARIEGQMGLIIGINVAVLVAVIGVLIRLIF